MPMGTACECRGGWIRTSDRLLPKQVRYQTALRPEDPLRNADAPEWTTGPVPNLR